MRFEIPDLAVVVGTSIYAVRSVDISGDTLMLDSIAPPYGRSSRAEKTTTIVVEGEVREVREAFMSGRMVVAMSDEGRRAAGANKEQMDALHARIAELEREVARVTLTNSALLTGDL